MILHMWAVSGGPVGAALSLMIALLQIVISSVAECMAPLVRVARFAVWPISVVGSWCVRLTPHLCSSRTCHAVAIICIGPAISMSLQHGACADPNYNPGASASG